MVEVLTGFRLLDGLNVSPPISDRRARTAGHWDIGKVCRLILLVVEGAFYFFCGLGIRGV